MPPVRRCVSPSLNLCRCPGHCPCLRRTSPAKKQAVLAFCGVLTYRRSDEQKPGSRPDSEAEAAMKNQRKHERVRVQFRSHFSMKGKMLAGDGDLTDLSPGGCRILTSIQVLVGAEVELCIFPGDNANPILIDGATVRWCRPRSWIS